MSCYHDIAVKSLETYLSRHRVTGDTRCVVFGLSTELLRRMYETVRARCNDTVVVPIAGTRRALGVWDFGHLELIPFLITDSPVQRDSNTGTWMAFSALRRSFSGQGNPRVLLAFNCDSGAYETVDTTVSTDIAESALLPRGVVKYLLELAAKRSPLVRSVASAYAELLMRESQPSPEAVERLANFLEATEKYEFDSARVGEALSCLGVYLADPHIRPEEAEKRLRDNARRKRQIEEWASSPTVDFREELAREYDDELAQRLDRVRRGYEIDWTGVTYQTLLNHRRRDTPSSAQDEEVKFSYLPGDDLGLSNCRRYVRGNTAVILLDDPEGFVWEPRFTRELRGQETVHLVWFDGGRRRTQVLCQAGAPEGPRTIRVAALSASLQTFGMMACQIVLTAGRQFRRNFLDQIVLVIYQAGLRTVPVEDNLDIDFENHAYRVTGVPSVRVISIADRGLSVSHPRDQLPDQEQVGDDPVPIRVDGADIELRVVFASETSSETGKERKPRFKEEVRIWRLESGRDVRGGEARPEVFVVGKEIYIKEGSEQLPLAQDAEIMHWEAEAEDYILRHESILAFKRDVDGDEPLAPWEDIERRQGEPADAFAAFMTARSAFFRRVREACEEIGKATIHAVNLLEMPEARQYVEAYLDLLKNLPLEQPVHTARQRALLVDAVLVDGDGTRYLYFAPTNPLTVAFYMRVQELVEEWCREEPNRLIFDSGDSMRISQQHLLPLLPAEGCWWKSMPCESFLWRRYGPISQVPAGNLASNSARLVAERIRKFLSVHPLYKATGSGKIPRRMVITFINPGDTRFIVDALRELFASEEQAADMPYLDLQLVYRDRVPATNELDVVFSAARSGFGAADWQLAVVQKVRYTVHRANDGQVVPRFSHITFVANDTAVQPTAYPMPMSAYPESLAVGGIVPIPTRHVQEAGGGQMVFVRGVWMDSPPSDCSPCERVLRGLVQRMHEQALVEGNRTKGASELAPYAHATVFRDIMPRMYEQSVWVVHMDKELGIEVFATPNWQEESAPFLIDYHEDSGAGFERHVWITATKRVDPYVARMRDVLGSAVSVDVEDISRVVRDMNMLSGRWALAMLTEPADMIRGRVGVVLAARYLLWEEELLNDINGGVSIILPLDDVVRVAPNTGITQASGLARRTLRRLGLRGQSQWADDLMVVRIVFGERPQVYARVVEVKYVSDGVPDWELASNQIRQTVTALIEWFGHPEYGGGLFRSSELAMMLGEQFERLRAYGAYPKDMPDEEVRRALSNILRGNYTFDYGFTYEGTKCVGEVISVEPAYSQAFFRGVHAGILRTRLGSPLVQYLVSRRGRPAYRQGEVAWTASRTDQRSDDVERRDGRESDTRVQLGAGGLGDDEMARHVSHPEVPIPRVAGSPVPPRHGSREKDHSEQLRRASEEPVRGWGTSLNLAVLGDALDRAFAQYRLNVEPFNPDLAQVGPSVIRMRTRTIGAQRLDQIQRLQDDLARVLAVQLQGRDDVLAAVKPDTLLVSQEGGFVCVDLARSEPAQVSIASLEEDIFHQALRPGELRFAVGIRPTGELVTADLADLPHLLVAGTTGSGKTSFLRGLIWSLAARTPADSLRLVVADPKGVDFSALNGLPHLLPGSVLTRAEEILDYVRNLLPEEHERRIDVFQRWQVASARDYYERDPDGVMRVLPIAIVIDEVGMIHDLLGDRRNEFDRVIQQYAQMARFLGIHVVLAIQRPSAAQIIGDIKVNFPARVALRVPSSVDSKVILDRPGAERLVGQGDLLFRAPDQDEPMRLQAPRADVSDLVALVKRWGGEN